MSHMKKVLDTVYNLDQVMLVSSETWNDSMSRPVQGCKIWLRDGVTSKLPITPAEFYRLADQEEI